MICHDKCWPVIEPPAGFGQGCPLTCSSRAAMALFLAIDPISDTFRTLVNVVSNLASLSLIFPRPRPEEAIASAITHANSHSTSGDRASSSSRS